MLIVNSNYYYNKYRYSEGVPTGRHRRLETIALCYQMLQRGEDVYAWFAERSIIRAMAEPYVKAAKAYKEIDFKQINVYQEELDAINYTQVPLWCKQFCYVLMCYCKSLGVKRVEVRKVYTDIIALCKVSRGKDDYMSIISKSGLVKVVFKAGRCMWEPTMIVSGGTLEASYDCLYDALEQFDNINYYAVCEECKSVFVYANARAQTKLCPECYKHKRYALQNSYKRHTTT